MQETSSPPIPSVDSEAGIPGDEPTSSSLFDWSDFLDFNLDEGLHVSFEPDSSGRVRKRDPRLVCSNFLAGRVPCACPELDAKLLEEEGERGKKRTRLGRVPARCQVPDCQVDISQLKGYHKRHRVCLRCANAASVVLDGETKRYCQQCGKFHILSDFDEDKRSCRRKLERHNNRRRRKPNDSKEDVEKESQVIILASDLSGDDDTGKDIIRASGQIEASEILLESDRQVSAPGSQNLQSDSVASFTTSDNTHVEADKQNLRFKQFPLYSDNKSSFSSACPAGRISFKLYDWNPAEFPRPLRHQIFQWLASMPVELEGYIRPGCTILTAFIAMPKTMWCKYVSIEQLSEDPALCIKDIVSSPGSLLSGRGTMHVYLNDTIFRVTTDASSVLKVQAKDQAPKLHYIYPNCFEAGRPMEFVACGSDLLQPNFRCLISFSGQYLAYDIRVSSHAYNADHQLLKIYVPQLDAALSGPAFVEVENQSGLSNFIPILIGDKETCEEMEVLLRKGPTPFFSREGELSSSQPACEVFASRQADYSELVLDVAWLLKKPVSKQNLTSSHIQRLNCLLEYLMENKSSVILGGLYSLWQAATGNNLESGNSDSDVRLLHKNMETARRRLAPKLHEKEFPVMPAPNGNCYSHSSENGNTSLGGPVTNQGVERTLENMLGVSHPSSSLDEDIRIPLLKDEVMMNVNIMERRGRSCSRSLSNLRLVIMGVVMSVGVCLGVCAVVLHPQRISQIVHNCLFDTSS